MGNKTLLIATISPSSPPDMVNNTLYYAVKTKKIQNKPQINQRLSQKKVIKNLMLKNEQLQRELATQRSKAGGIFWDAEHYESYTKSYEERGNTILELKQEKEEYEREMSQLRFASEKLKNLNEKQKCIIEKKDDDISKL